MHMQYPTPAAMISSAAAPTLTPMYRPGMEEVHKLVVCVICEKRYIATALAMLLQGFQSGIITPEHTGMPPRRLSGILLADSPSGKHIDISRVSGGPLFEKNAGCYYFHYPALPMTDRNHRSLLVVLMFKKVSTIEDTLEHQVTTVYLCPILIRSGRSQVSSPIRSSSARDRVADACGTHHARKSQEPGMIETAKMPNSASAIERGLPQFL